MIWFPREVKKKKKKKCQRFQCLQFYHIRSKGKVARKNTFVFATV